MNEHRIIRVGSKLERAIRISRSPKIASFYSISLREMEADDDLGLGINTYTTQHRKRVMVVIDGSNSSKAAIIWALTHVVNNVDLLTLLHIIPHQSDQNQSAISTTNYLGSFCKACKPQVEVESLVLQGPKLATVISQVKKLQVSVLILAHSSSSPLHWLFCGGGSRCRSEEFVDECIKSVDCLTVGVRKQKKGVGGYLITTKWKRNFWLLA